MPYVASLGPNPCIVTPYKSKSYKSEERPITPREESKWGACEVLWLVAGGVTGVALVVIGLVGSHIALAIGGGALCLVTLGTFIWKWHTKKGNALPERTEAAARQDQQQKQEIAERKRNRENAKRQEAEDEKEWRILALKDANAAPCEQAAEGPFPNQYYPAHYQIVRQTQEACEKARQEIFTLLKNAGQVCPRISPVYKPKDGMFRFDLCYTHNELYKIFGKDVNFNYRIHNNFACYAEEIENGYKLYNVGLGNAEVPVRPLPSTIMPPPELGHSNEMTPPAVIKQILSSNIPYLIIAEEHYQNSPLEFFKTYSDDLARAGFEVIVMEHFDIAYQSLLDRYYWETLDKLYVTSGFTQRDEAVPVLKKVGIRTLGAESRYSRGLNNKSYGDEDEGIDSSRKDSLDQAAVYALETALKQAKEGIPLSKNPDGCGRAILWVGAAHAKGIAQRLGRDNCFILGVADGEKEGVKVKELFYKRYPTDAIIYLKRQAPHSI